MSAVYDSRTHLGDVEATPAGFVARDADGKRIGTFKTSKQAIDFMVKKQKEAVGLATGGGEKSNHRVAKKPADKPTLAEAGINKHLADKAQKAKGTRGTLRDKKASPRGPIA
jgi:hypothetical protein